jgi:hypothetical protein
MAVYFPRGQQSFATIKSKFLDDHQGVASNAAVGMAFVTNQELTLSERKALADAIDTPAEIFHLERLTTILDRPDMASVRAQFLGVGAAPTEPPMPARTTRQIFDTASPPPGAPAHRSVYEGVVLLQAVAAPVPAVAHHPHAADPRAVLESASHSAQVFAEAWPERVSLLAERLSDGWHSMAPHRWGAGHTSGDADSLARHASAAVVFRTDTGVICVDRTWPSAVLDDNGAFAFYAAREPEVVAELLVSLRLVASLMGEISDLAAVDIAALLAAAPSGKTLVASERAVSGRRFGAPAGYLKDPVADVPSHFVDSGRFSIADVRDAYAVAQRLLGPWLATFRTENLFDRLRDG